MDVEVSLQLHPSLFPTAGAPSSPDAIALTQAIAPAQWQRWFTQWFEHLQPQLSPIQAYTLGLTLTNDTEIHQLNQTYRGYDRPTDVLAFAASETQGVPATVWQAMPLELGDIVISVETVLRQAPQHHHRPQQELVWLASHGLLHLLGWDHPTPNDLQRMLDQQDQLLDLTTLL